MYAIILGKIALAQLQHEIQEKIMSFKIQLSFNLYALYAILDMLYFVMSISVTISSFLTLLYISYNVNRGDRFIVLQVSQMLLNGLTNPVVVFIFDRLLSYF